MMDSMDIRLDPEVNVIDSKVEVAPTNTLESNVVPSRADKSCDSTVTLFYAGGINVRPQGTLKVGCGRPVGHVDEHLAKLEPGNVEIKWVE